MHLTRDAAMDEIVRSTRRWYDQEAADYAARTAEYAMYPGLLAEISEFAVSVAGVEGPVLDLGCGAGRDTRFLLDQGLQVVAADLSESMLRTTAVRCAGYEPSCVQVDMRQMPFETGSFAGAWVCASMVHLPAAELGDCLVGLFRTLRSKGRIAISMKAGTGEGWRRSSRSRGQRWFTFVDTDPFREMMAEGGFVDLSVVSSGRGNWYVALGSKP